MKHQEFIRPGMVELALQHMPGCRCDLETPDREATLVQLGCVTGYLVERVTGSQPSGGEAGA